MSDNMIQQQQQQPPLKKRTRRGGRGGGRRRRKQQQLYPWWYSCMLQAHLTPDGLEPNDDGFPVVLPSRQAVYILKNAVNPHRASTFVPYVYESESDVDEPQEGPPPPTDNGKLDILAVARQRSFFASFHDDDLPVSLSFLDDDDVIVTDDDASCSSSVYDH